MRPLIYAAAILMPPLAIALCVAAAPTAIILVTLSKLKGY